MKKVKDKCDICKKYAQSPQRFKLTVVVQKHWFKQELKVDSMFILGSPVSHTVNLETHFYRARFLTKTSTQNIKKEYLRTLDTVLFRFSRLRVAIPRNSICVTWYEERLWIEGNSYEWCRDWKPRNNGRLRTWWRSYTLSIHTWRKNMGRDALEKKLLAIAVLYFHPTIGP